MLSPDDIDDRLVNFFIYFVGNVQHIDIVSQETLTENGFHEQSKFTAKYLFFVYEILAKALSSRLY